MPSRLVKVYDGPFPSVEDIIFGDPATLAPFPKEVWTEQMEEGEVALFCVNFKNDRAVREEDGKPGPQSDEVCRVSSDITELQRHARDVVRRHATTVCVLRGKDGTEIQRISNRRFLLQFAFAAYLGIGIWLIALTALGSGVILLVRALIATAPSTPFAGLPSLSVAGWTALLAAGFIIAVFAVLGWTWFSVRRRVQRTLQTFDQALTSEEKLRYKEMDLLSVSPNLEDRQRAKQLLKEYHHRLAETRYKE